LDFRPRETRFLSEKLGSFFDAVGSFFIGVRWYKWAVFYTSIFISEKWFGRCRFVFASPGSFYHISVRNSMCQHSNARIVIQTHTDCFVCQEVQAWFSENFIARFIEWNESFLCNAVNRSAMRLTAVHRSVAHSTAVNKGHGEYFISKYIEIRMVEVG
jgi:hypothetical protein